MISQLLLLSGPPGLGKTTLAHIVARQAGYEVMEINARHVQYFDLTPCIDVRFSATRDQAKLSTIVYDLR